MDEPEPVGPDRADRERRTAPEDREAITRDALREYATEFLLLLKPDGRLVATSEASTLGYGRNERRGHHIAEHLHPEDLLLVFDLIERARETPGFRETVRVRARSKNGDWGWFEAEVIDATRDQRLRGAVLRVREITGEVAGAVPGPLLSDADAMGSDRFLSLAEALPLGILSADARGSVVFANSSAKQILNGEGRSLLDRGWEQAVHREDLADVLDAASQVVTTGAHHQVTFRVETGLFQRWAHAKFVPLGGPVRRTGWIATIEDVTDRRRAESELAHLATHDPLTDLPNRTLLEDRLRQACGRLRRDGDQVTVFFVDLDGFKEINDEHGHAVGDEVLREVGRRLRHVVRDVDTVARLGGDEFVVLSEGLDTEAANAVVERIHEALAVPTLAVGRRLAVGASVGVARSRETEPDSSELLSRADQAMYRAKAARRSSS